MAIMVEELRVVSKFLNLLQVADPSLIERIASIMEETSDDAIERFGSEFALALEAELEWAKVPVKADPTMVPNIGTAIKGILSMRAMRIDRNGLQVHPFGCAWSPRYREQFPIADSAITQGNVP